MTRRARRATLAVVLAALLLAATALTAGIVHRRDRNTVVAYFANANGVFVGDEVRILGVPVGAIEEIEPQPDRAKVTFWYESKYRVPVDVAAVVISPSLVTARAIQLTPAYTGGETLRDNSVIGQDRTAVPVEWDDLRTQLERLTTSLQPTEPGGVSTVGALVNTAADNLRSRGATIRETVIQLSEAFSALGNHSSDIFSTVRNLAVLVSALQSTSGLMTELNQNLATVTHLMANGTNEVDRAVADINTAIGDVRVFAADNREAIGTASEKFSSISTALVESLDDIEQALHVGPNTVQNVVNMYQPAHSSNSGNLMLNNFADPITFLCGAVQAASRMNAEQAAKLCVQYLAPIIKNRQYNFPPIGVNPIVGPTARPNEITYSEDWMRPDYRPAAAADPSPAPLPAEAPISTDPTAGLPGMMVPPEGGR